MDFNEGVGEPSKEEKNLIWSKMLGAEEQSVMRNDDWMSNNILMFYLYMNLLTHFNIAGGLFYNCNPTDSHYAHWSTSTSP